MNLYEMLVLQISGIQTTFDIFYSIKECNLYKIQFRYKQTFFQYDTLLTSNKEK